MLQAAMSSKQSGDGSISPPVHGCKNAFQFYQQGKCGISHDPIMTAKTVLGYSVLGRLFWLPHIPKWGLFMVTA